MAPFDAMKIVDEKEDGYQNFLQSVSEAHENKQRLLMLLADKLGIKEDKKSLVKGVAFLHRTSKINGVQTLSSDGIAILVEAEDNSRQYDVICPGYALGRFNSLLNVESEAYRTINGEAFHSTCYFEYTEDKGNTEQSIIFTTADNVEERDNQYYCKINPIRTTWENPFIYDLPRLVTSRKIELEEGIKEEAITVEFAVGGPEITFDNGVASYRKTCGWECGETQELYALTNPKYANDKGDFVYLESNPTMLDNNNFQEAEQILLNMQSINQRMQRAYNAI